MNPYESPKEVPRRHYSHWVWLATTLAFFFVLMTLITGSVAVFWFWQLIKYGPTHPWSVSLALSVGACLLATCFVAFLCWHNAVQYWLKRQQWMTEEDADRQG